MTDDDRSPRPAAPSTGAAPRIETTEEGWRIRATGLLFDMDGTLVDSTAVVEANWADFATRWGVDVRDILASSHGRKADDTVRAFGPVDVDVAATVIEMHDREMELTDGIIAIPGAADFLASLPRDRVALVTSAPRRLAVLRMNVAGVDAPDVTVSADDVENGKPHPEPYLTGASLLGIAPEEIVVFEDAEAGLLSARAAGMSAVVVGPHIGDSTDGLPRITDYAQISVTLLDDGIELAIRRAPGA